MVVGDDRPKLAPGLWASHSALKGVHDVLKPIVNIVVTEICITQIQGDVQLQFIIWHKDNTFALRRLDYNCMDSPTPRIAWILVRRTPNPQSLSTF